MKKIITSHKSKQTSPDTETTIHLDEASKETAPSQAVKQASADKGMTIHLDENCVRELKMLKRRLDLEAGDFAPLFSLPALARHCIRKWCDHVAAPLPRPWEEQPDSEV